jgi:hypothetical protein
MLLSSCNKLCNAWLTTCMLLLLLHMFHPLQGTLPVLNAEAVSLAIKAGIALNSTIARRSKFDRKQYFYAGELLGPRTCHCSPDCQRQQCVH